MDLKSKRKNGGKTQKGSFFYIFPIFLLAGAVAFSKGTVGRFFTVLVIELFCSCLIYFAIAYATNKNRGKPGAAAAGEGGVKRRYKLNTESPTDRDMHLAEMRMRKNFNWVVGERDAEKAVEHPETSPSVKREISNRGKTRTPSQEKNNDIKVQVAHWSSAVEFSGSVHGNLINKAYAAAETSNTAVGAEDGEPGAETQEEPVESWLKIRFDSMEDLQEPEGKSDIPPETVRRVDEAYGDSLEAQAGEETAEESGETEAAKITEETEDTREIEDIREIEDTEDVEYIGTEDTEYPEEAEETVEPEPMENMENAEEMRDREEPYGNAPISVAGVYSDTSRRRPEMENYGPPLMPPIELLQKNEEVRGTAGAGSDPESTGRKLIETLSSFGVGAKIINISRGPAVTRYEIQPDYGVKVSKIVNLTDDIALNLAATGVRIEAPIPGKAAIGIEIPNREVTPVLLREVLESEEFHKHSSKIAFAVGKDIAGNPVVSDIARMPHLLIAGATGSGKSVCINTLIASILYKSSPDQVRLLMVDPKVVELGIYNGIPHLLIPVVTDPKKAAGALNWAVQEMINRYRLFADNNVRDLKGYNQLMKENPDGNPLPQVVIIIDELADLMMVAPDDVEECICRLAQMARAAGMHLVIATQRPSVDVITGVIKANVPSRISFAVSSQIDSRTILDMAGAEKLLGRGDMLFSPLGMPKPVRVQGALITDKEVEALVSFIKSHAPAQYDEGVLEKIDSSYEASQLNAEDEDDLLEEVTAMVIEQGQASTSLVQRKFKLGYARAARIVDQLEAGGIVGPFEGSKPRRVLITKQQWQEMNG